jgi:CO/xanthine dehydrogenase Mo-binding subunit
MELSKLRVTASEIGGGFGGKTVVYLEPLALALSRKAGKPVKMTMTREEVFMATGPAPGANMTVKMGVRKDGTIVAAICELRYQAGAFQGAPIQPGAMCAFAPYDIEHVTSVGYDVVTNRPKVAAYRAPGGPMAEYGVESVVDELAVAIGMDPIELRKERRSRRHPCALRRDLRPGRFRGNARRGEGARALQRAAQAQSGPWRRVRILVQHRR